MLYIHANSGSPIQKLVATLIGLSLLALVLMFSVVMIPVIAVAALIGMGYFYWKTRAIRKAMAKQASNEGFINGDMAFKWALQEELDSLYWGRANARERFSLESLIQYVSKA